MRLKPTLNTSINATLIEKGFEFVGIGVLKKLGLYKDFTSDTLDSMQQEVKPKKALHLKVALTVIFSTLSPYLLGLFFQPTPLLYLLVATLSVAVSIIFLFWILKPLSNLIKSTSIFSDGNLNHRIDIRSGDELEDVGNSFNLMAEKLAQTIQNLQREHDIAVSEKNRFGEILSSVIDGIIALDFNKRVIFLNESSSQLTGYTEAEIYGKPIDQVIHLFGDQEEIFSKTYCSTNFNQTGKLVGKMGKQTKVSLTTTQVDGTVQTNLNCILILHDLSREEELEQMKLDFVSMASHELKTPLTNITGYLSVFLNENANTIPKENLELLNKAYTAAQQLQTLIQNLLNVNKIEKEEFSVTPEPIDYLAILSKTVEDLRGQATQKSIVLNLNSPSQALPKVLADPIRLGEVITNLVANAINYTNPGGRIEILTEISPNEVQTTISDTGIGIPSEAIPHLFSKFFRVSNRLQHARKGTGLGLYISKSIIEKLRGRIWVESELGKGSKFHFTLPTVSLSAGSLDRSRFDSEAIQAGTLNY